MNIYHMLFIVCCCLLHLWYQVDLENSNKALLDLQEQHQLAISLLKEKEIIISKLRQSGSLIRGRTVWIKFCHLLFFLPPISFTHEKLCTFCVWTENSLIGRAKEMQAELQCASEDISSLFVKLGTCGVILITAKQLNDLCINYATWFSSKLVWNWLRKSGWCKNFFQG